MEHLEFFYTDEGQDIAGKTHFSDGAYFDQIYTQK
jgi:ABC-type sulfate transport system substrate-binding protein